jgi:transposase
MNSRTWNGLPSGRFCRTSRVAFPVLTTGRPERHLLGSALWRSLARPAGILWPRTPFYNRFVRWRQVGVCDRIMDALAAGHDAAVEMIDTFVMRVHQHGACIADNNHQDVGRSRGGLTCRIHAVVDTNGLPDYLALTPGEAHDNPAVFGFAQRAVPKNNVARRSRI